MIDVSNISKASDAWGPDMPRWISLLADAADRLGQKAAGAAIGRSGGFVSRVLRNDYPGNLGRSEALTVARFGSASVDCPEFGDIPHESCRSNRRRKGPPANFLQRRFADACPTCPHNPDIIKETSDVH
jgi:hypothetical protein